jgi:hypothetical protein
MKKLVLVTVAATALTLIPGCGKKAETKVAPVEAQGTMKEKMGAAKEGVADVAKEAAKAEAAVPAVTTPAAPEAEKAQAAVETGVAKAGAAATAATSAFDKLVTEAKALIADKKYQDALTKLQGGLQHPALDAAQKSTLQKLLDQVKAALATDAGKAVQEKAGNLLKGVGGQ